jgi:outer membrane protein assembly factor BamE
VQFKADALSQIEGDELPSENEFVQRLVGDKKISAPPLLQATEDDLRKYPPAKAANPVSVTPPAPLPSSYPPLEPAVR